jgi:hypothetical protein
VYPLELEPIGYGGEDFRASMIAVAAGVVAAGVVDAAREIANRRTTVRRAAES